MGSGPREDPTNIYHKPIFYFCDIYLYAPLSLNYNNLGTVITTAINSTSLKLDLKALCFCHYYRCHWQKGEHTKLTLP